MNEDTKQALQLALEILRKTCIEQGVSIAVNKENGDLNFFDTNTYLQTKEYKGIKVSIESLVR